MSEFVVLVSVILVNQTISEHSEGLVDPKLDEVWLALKAENIDHQNTLDDLGQISQVERVVALSGSR